MKAIIISILAILLVSYYAAANAYAIESTSTQTDNPSDSGKPDVSPSPGQTNDKNTPDKVLPQAEPSSIPNPTTTVTTTTNNPTDQHPTEPGPGNSHPDKNCAFNPDSPKCHPDDKGNCPTGFAHNVHNNCFPSGKCPSGFSRHDNDETGKCFSNHIHHPTHTIVVHTGSSSGSHSLSSSCFNEIKIAWVGKIQRGDNSKVDKIIDDCLNIH